MAIDTLAYVKELESAGVDRATAEAHVVAFARDALPDVTTKADLALLGAWVETKLANLTDDLSWRFFGMLIAVTALMNGVLFALLRVVH